MMRTKGSLTSRAESGFTLMEVLVASVLLLIAVAGFVPFFLSGLEKSSVSRYQSAATNIGREMMEQIRQLDYREITEDPAQPTDPANLSNRLPITREVRGATFNIDYIVEDSTSGGGQLKRVVVTVGWDGNPAGEPAIVSSLIHQQYLGPRISSIEFTSGSTSADPLGTPFPLLSTTAVANIFIATPDFELIYENLNQPGMAARDVYLLLSFVDEAGASVPVGDPANNHRISNAYLRQSIDANGIVTQVWFEVPLDTTSIPDGYWELQGVVHNQYDQQGNVWRLQARLDHTAPDPPASVLAIAGADNQSIHVTWVPGSERDRAQWILERQKSPDGVTYPGIWTTVATLPGTASMFDDVGSVSGMIDPWGDALAAITNHYEYRVWAVDLAGNVGPAATAREQIPSAVSTSTTLPVTSTTGATTSTTGPATYSVTVQNHTSKAYDVTVTDAGSSIVFTGRVTKNGGSLDVNGLPVGQYSITALEVAQATPRMLTAGFALPDRAGQIVLDILP